MEDKKEYAMEDKKECVIEEPVKLTKIIMDGMVDNDTFAINGQVLKPMDIIVTDKDYIIEAITSTFKGSIYEDDAYVDVVRNHFAERERVRDEARKGVN